MTGIARQASSPIGLRSVAPYDVFTTQPSEIVIGLVGPLGTDNAKIQRMLAQRIDSYGYKSELIRISRVIIPALAGPERIPDEPKFAHCETLINLGNQIRIESKNAAVLAIAAAAEIGRRRPDGEVTKQAYIVSSLKLSEEVAELRKIYTRGFYLFGVHTGRQQRIKNLRGLGGTEMTEAEATELITRDEHEPHKFGQHTRDTFALADFFCADEGNDDKLRHSIHRCLDLVFGNPTITPTFNEFAMFMAFTASLRSADLARQVGAVVARSGEILSTGANDCPRAGGGLYWPEFIGDRVDDAPRGRDYKRGVDSNDAERNRLIKEISSRFEPDQRERAAEVLSASSLKDIMEYGRSVHAEMEALLACARGNTSCLNADLYSTTFPCHNCAKHIIAAGIRQVIYIEPYPKSKAFEFHDDALIAEKFADEEDKVRFKPFIGVGPRQFFDLFSMSLSSGHPMIRKQANGAIADWQPQLALPRVQMLPVHHRNFEGAAAEYCSKLRPGGGDPR